MAQTIHVNGASVIKLGDQGTANSPSVLGVTENGPLIDIEYHKEPVMADSGGPNLPVDLQKMGYQAKITFALPIYDLTVLTSRILSQQKGTNEGQLAAMGGLIFANNGGFRLIISSPIDTQPWRFYYCSVDYCRLRPGSKYNIYDIGIDAIANIGAATSSADVVLYDHVDA